MFDQQLELEYADTISDSDQEIEDLREQPVLAGTDEEVNIKQRLRQKLMIKQRQKEKYHENIRKGVFSCDSCPFRAGLKTNLQIHLFTHTGERPFRCSFCHYSSKTVHHLERHELRAHTDPENKPFKCTKCEFTAAYSWHLKEHSRIHSGEKPYKCDQCPYSATMMGTLTQHKATHSSERNFHCTECSYKAKTKVALRNHERRGVHGFKRREKPEPLTFKCSVCDFTTTTASKLSRHTLQVHTITEDKPFKCTKCEFTSARSWHLKEHQRVHSGEKPYKCNHCSYSAAMIGTLNRHKATHSSERNFHCTICPYKSKTKEGLRQHGKWCP